ncbi:MAG: sugar O-acetyltransferase [Oscillospiraceae bacterium]|nr:sugar O-acetyltransferase [Oscillospiraceae bacterium]
MTEKERMLAGKLYCADDEELRREDMRKWRLLQAINRTPDPQKVRSWFRELLGSIGEPFWIQPDFYCDYGSHIHIGKHFYANYGCVMLDGGGITIGDDVFLAPRVSIYTAAHPIDAGVRNQDLEYCRPVKIGSSVWIGGNVVINPGVTIGDDVVIGSGSVVTRNIPSHVVAAGNPCRVLRSITEEDKRRWEEQAAEYHREMGH